MRPLRLRGALLVAFVTPPHHGVAKLVVVAVVVLTRALFVAPQPYRAYFRPFVVRAVVRAVRLVVVVGSPVNEAFDALPLAHPKLHRHTPLYAPTVVLPLAHIRLVHACKAVVAVRELART